MMNFEERIKIFRQRQKLSQLEVGKAAGVSGATICRIEKGAQTPSFTLAVNLVKALGVPVNEFFELNEPDPKYLDQCTLGQFRETTLDQIDQIYQELSKESRDILLQVVNNICNS